MKRKSIPALGTPHRSIAASSLKERFALELFDGLWARYRARVPYVQAYERVVAQAGGVFVNDHVAFRTLARQDPWSGIASVSRVFQALGYEPAACYVFADKHLSSVHFQHPNPGFPKLFVSELKTWELSAGARRMIARAVKTQGPALPDETLSSLASVAEISPARREKLLARVSGYFQKLPWPAPQKRDVEALNAETQFGAWVLVHGREVNHFTASVNSHGVAALGDIEKTVAALRAAGVPMKGEIEGAPGSKLRQSATEAAVIAAAARDGRRRVRMPWTYAYFEIAERGNVLDPQTGRPARFEGFLGGQAAQLFEMTRFKAGRKRG